jgi:choice-of-anchor B domain-containing protein
VTDKSAPRVLSTTSYVGASYVHQGWVLDPEWQEYLISDDEYDEFDKAGLAADGHPVTYIWDIKDLEAPKQTGYYKSAGYSVDHNQYVHDGYSYQSNYGSGFRVLDISSIPEDPTGKGVEEVGFFDVYPEDDALPNGGVIDFVGTWSSYSYFKSGYIFINTIERGGFVLKMRES